MDDVLAEYRKNLEDGNFTSLGPEWCAPAIDAENMNRIIESMGGAPVAVNQPGPDEDGSNTALVSTYLILLLADRIAALEAQLS